MYSKKVMMTEDLFAKNATAFVQKANDFKSCVWIEKKEKQVSAKSLLGVLALGVISGDVVSITADGTDEVSTVDFLVELIESKFNVRRES